MANFVNKIKAAQSKLSFPMIDSFFYPISENLSFQVINEYLEVYGLENENYIGYRDLSNNDVTQILKKAPYYEKTSPKIEIAKSPLLEIDSIKLFSEINETNKNQIQGNLTKNFKKKKIKIKRNDEFESDDKENNENSQEKDLNRKLKRNIAFDDTNNSYNLRKKIRI